VNNKKQQESSIAEKQNLNSTGKSANKMIGSFKNGRNNQIIVSSIINE
jgi:hypothetical protein